MTTYEVCPHCMNEVEIQANERSECPNCGELILPCSTCDDELEGYKGCDWTEEKGCWRFNKKSDS